MAKGKFIEYVEKDGIYYGIHKDVIDKIYAEGKIPIVITT